MTKQNYIEPLVTTRKPTPEEWLANHERLHNEDNMKPEYQGKAMKKFFELAVEAAWWTLGVTLLFAFFWVLLGLDLTY